MPIALACPRCDKLYQLDDRLAGKKGRCKQCGSVFLIPETVPAVALPIEPPPMYEPAPVPQRAPATEPMPAPMRWPKPVQPRRAYRARERDQPPFGHGLARHVAVVTLVSGLTSFCFLIYQAVEGNLEGHGAAPLSIVGGAIILIGLAFVLYRWIDETGPPARTGLILRLITYFIRVTGVLGSIAGTWQACSNTYATASRPPRFNPGFYQPSVPTFTPPPQMPMMPPPQFRMPRSRPF